MKKFLIFSVLILYFTISGFISAQENNFTPFVSQIRAEARNNLVRLTWEDSPDAQGPVYIFRSARPFSGSVPLNIKPVVVRYGMQYYIDETDDIENLFYFIAASDISGNRYDIIIPLVNSIHIGTSGTFESREFLPAVQLPAAEAEPEGIYNLMAKQDREKVIITYNSTYPRRNVILYRSMQPFRGMQDLLNAVIIYAGFETTFTDYPAAGLSWYYAAIYEDEISSGNIEVKPGVNATVSALTIFNETIEQPIRPIPLPVLTLETLAAEGFLLDFSQYTPLSDISVNTLRDTLDLQKPPHELKKPRVFTIDIEEPKSGEESALFQIIKDYFEKFDWEGARVSLQRYLSLPRSPDIEARARFYLGQTLYYSGHYREALFEFLSFRSFNSIEANIWIDAVLSAMVY